MMYRYNYRIFPKAVLLFAGMSNFGNDPSKGIIQANKLWLPTFNLDVQHFSNGIWIRSHEEVGKGKPGVELASWINGWWRVIESVE